MILKKSGLVRLAILVTVIGIMFVGYFFYQSNPDENDSMSIQETGVERRNSRREGDE